MKTIKSCLTTLQFIVGNTINTIMIDLTLENAALKTGHTLPHDVWHTDTLSLRRSRWWDRDGVE